MVSENWVAGCEPTASEEDLLAEFGGWLNRQRGLAPVTVHNYCWNVGRFLAVLPEPVRASVCALDAAAVTGFMVEFCRNRNTNSAKAMARSIRSFLRFAHATGLTSIELWGTVPSAAGGTWHPCRRPSRPLILSGCSRSPPRLGPLRRDGVTTRSCCCWSGWGCAVVRSLPWLWRTSIGGPGNSRSTARATGSNDSRFRPRRERRSPSG